MVEYEVKMTLTEEALGTAPGNVELYRDWVASKHPTGVIQPDELVTIDNIGVDIDDEVNKGVTFFHRTDKNEPFIYDYVIKGFFKDACGALRKADDTLSSKVKAYKKEIDGLIFINPRQIVCQIPEGLEMGFCERPLRCSTPQGERVALARSETIPAGTVLEFRVTLLTEKLEDVMYEWFDYGKYRCLGQWRNSGKGRATFDIKKV